jgi:hypothetical protein
MNVLYTGSGKSALSNFFALAERSAKTINIQLVNLSPNNGLNTIKKEKIQENT